MAENRAETSLMQGMDIFIRSLVCEDCWAGPFSQKSFRELVGGASIVYKTTWSKIQQATNRGCGLCSLLVEDSFDKVPTEDDVSIIMDYGPLKASLSGFQNITPLRAQILRLEIEDAEYEVSNDAHILHTPSDNPAAAEIITRDTLRDVHSSKSFSLALSRLEDCLNSHDTCPKPNPHATLPTRVINCSDPSRPKLFTAKGLQKPYVALSYVWGGPQPDCTTSRNIEQYSLEIDVNIIPRTILDAIKATHHFGFSYLWVDAFCIIQDDSDDKKKELVKLRQIFRDAHFTIIASSADSAFAGFLKTLPLPSTSYPTLPFWCKDGKLGFIHTQPLYAHYDATGEPANQRAWCLEERLLSGRKLVYASDTLHYHCQTAVNSIGGSYSGPRKAERLPDILFMPDRAVQKHVADWTFRDWNDLRALWSDIVQNYTGRAVTKPKDKLTAFAGVAEQFDRVWPLMGSDFKAETNRSYLAGLWSHSLMHDLLWAKYHGTLSPRPSFYLAPSWSWASIHGEVSAIRTVDRSLHAAYFDDPSTLIACEILSCNIEVEDDRLPYGRVASGILKLRAKLTPISWSGGSYDSELGLFTGIDDLHGRPMLLRKAEADRLRWVGQVYLDSTEELEGQLWVLFITWNTNVNDAYAAGLVLKEANEASTEALTFRRIGFWETPELIDDTEEDREERVRWFSAEINEFCVKILEIV